MALIDQIGSLSKIFIWGLAKNTGKTVTISKLLDEGHARGKSMAITSIGRDGEEFDAIDNRIAKPRLNLPRGCLFATAESLLDKCEAKTEIVQTTPFRSPLGRIIIGRMVQTGMLEIAGPSPVGNVCTVSDMMMEAGADLVLIDGALDRKAAASPDICDGVVLATGAVLAEDMSAVVWRTQAAVEMLRLSPVDDSLPIPRLDPRLGGVAILDDARTVAYSRAALSGDDLCELARIGDGRPRYVITNGALVESFIDQLVTQFDDTEITFVVRDFTRLFVSEKKWERYKKRGIKFCAVHASALLALTANPVAPLSHRFRSEQFCEALARAVTDVKVFDVKSPSYPD